MHFRAQEVKMSYQFTFTDTFSGLEKIKFHITYRKNFSDPNNPDIDDAHIHNCYEIYVNVSGNVSFLVNKDILPIRPGYVLITKPGDVHHCILNSPCVHEHFCLWFEAIASSSLFDFLEKYKLIGLNVLEYTVQAEMFSLMYKLIELQGKDASIEKTICFLKMLDLLSQKAHSYEENKPQMPSELQKILEYINVHFAQIQHIEDISSKFYISSATITRWFREYIKLSPYKFLKAKKLAYAESLLKSGCSVTETAALAGFTDCPRFISFFKEKYGHTPLQYKKLHQN